MMQNCWLYRALFVVLALCPLAGHAEQSPPKTIAGWVEDVRFPDNNLVIKAKLDTGATTSSIYAINTQVFQKKERGKKTQDWVRFDLYLEDVQKEPHLLTLERPVVRMVNIKNHDGNHDERIVINLDFCFAGDTHQTEFTLANRTEFLYGVLLGRRFLSGVALVDSEARNLTSPSCRNGKEMHDGIEVLSENTETFPDQAR
ncbi:MAG: ATP-dependent zinc protease [Hahellaceae bacterium]|nr:ATP-dependent zinc protease [Hahellaceae bacterium]